MKCQNCGADIPDSAKFCTNCGMPVAKPSKSAQTQKISSDESSKDQWSPDSTQILTGIDTQVTQPYDQSQQYDAYKVGGQNGQYGQSQAYSPYGQTQSYSPYGQTQQQPTYAQGSQNGQSQQYPPYDRTQQMPQNARQNQYRQTNQQTQQYYDQNPNTVFSTENTYPKKKRWPWILAIVVIVIIIIALVFALFGVGFFGTGNDEEGTEDTLLSETITPNTENALETIEEGDLTDDTGTENAAIVEEEESEEPEEAVEEEEATTGNIADTTGTNGYVLPNSDTQRYTEEYLETLSDYDLWIARNEIYARHGRGFDNQELQNYFSSKSWYTRLYSPSEYDSMEDPRNDIERYNTDLIHEIEEERNSPYL
ncbi:MAG: YARHG domain-containing protein [Eggerthellaceae bacterium]|nr:YARHG domain-containing protein [Eggerthellaceae bacterium]